MKLKSIMMVAAVSFMLGACASTAKKLKLARAVLIVVQPLRRKIAHLASVQCTSQRVALTVKKRKRNLVSSFLLV